MSRERILEMMGFKDGKTGVVYFDMDGVIADFDGSIQKSGTTIKNLKDNYETLVQSHPATKNKNKDQVKAFLRDRDISGDEDLKVIKKALKDYNKAVFSFANKQHFFSNMGVLPGAKEMLQAAKDITGQKPKILTAPVLSNPHCEKEKLHWLHTHFPDMFGEFICTTEKGEHAKGLNSVLIDDRTKYIDKFTSNGGFGILHTNPKKTIAELKDWFENLSQSSDVEFKVNKGIIALSVPKDQIINAAIKASEDAGLIALQNDAFHITLLSNKSFNKLAPYINELDLSDISVTRPIYRKDKLFITKRDELNKVSSFLEVENQNEFSEIVSQILNKLIELAGSKDISFGYENLTEYDKNRFFHVSVANTDGNPYSSIGDIKREDRWYPREL